MVINETINQTVISMESLADSFINQVIPRFMELVTSPYNHPELLWITIPLIASLIVMDIYFGRYKGEELGWNTAIGNSLALMFVSMDLFRHIYNALDNPSIWNMFAFNFKGMLIIVILSFGSLWLFVAHFFRILPKRLAFIISSALPTSMFAYLAIILIYTQIPLDIPTFFAALMLGIVLFVVLKFVYWIIPTYRTQEDIDLIISESLKRV